MSKGKAFEIGNILGKGAFSLVFCILLFTAHPALADCTTATMGPKPAGAIFYNADFKVLQYCDGTDWIAMHGQGAGSGGCNTVTMGVKPEGHIFYNADNRVMQGCAGNVWRAMGPVPYVPNAVTFDGTNDILTRGGDLTGNADSKQVTGSFWIRTDDLSNSTDTIYTTANNKFRIRLGSSGDATHRDIRFLAAGGSTIDVNLVDAIGDRDWHHIVFSFDVSDPTKRHTYVDDVDASPTYQTYVDAIIDFTEAGHAIGGGTFGPSPALPADLADFWIDFGTYIDLSDPANRAKFYNNGPVYLGADGSLPTGAPPEIFLSGDTASWHTNKGTGGGFTENGTLTYASSQIPLMPGPTSGLTGWWKLDEGSGTNIENYAGTNEATVSAGAVWRTGKLGSAIEFDDNNESVNAGSDAVFDDMSAITGCGWFYFPVSPAGNDYLISKGNTTGNEGWALYTLNSQISFYTGYNDYVVTSANVLTTNTWQHLCFTWNGSDGTGGIKIYVDGIDITALNSFLDYQGDITYDSDTSYNLYIGANLGFDFLGYADDVRIYERALTGSEIAQLVRHCENPFRAEGTLVYNNPDGSLTDGLIHHWELEESGTPFVDSAGTNNGTEQNTVISATGIIGNAVGFDNGDGINLGNMAEINNASQLTLTAWLKRDAGFQSALVGKMNAAETHALALTHNSSDGLGCQVNNGAMAAAGIVEPDTQWHHVALVFDGSLSGNARLKCYVDGSTAGMLHGGTMPATTTSDTTDFYIGRLDGPGLSTNGLIDDVRIYDRALSASEVADLYAYDGNSAGVMQYCDGANWVAIGKGASSGPASPPVPTGCPDIGDVCSDGSVYAGLSPDGNEPMYTTPADAPGAYTWNEGTTNWIDTALNNAAYVTGEFNTAFLATLSDGASPYDAAVYCSNVHVHGHDDWYLPARDELNVLYDNLVDQNGDSTPGGPLGSTFGFNTSGSFPAGYYWSSSEFNATYAWHQRFGNGFQDRHNAKNDGFSVRCVRR